MNFDETKFPFKENPASLTSTLEFDQSYNFGEQYLGTQDRRSPFFSKPAPKTPTTVAQSSSSPFSTRLAAAQSSSSPSRSPIMHAQTDQPNLSRGSAPSCGHALAPDGLVHSCGPSVYRGPLPFRSPSFSRGPGSRPVVHGPLCDPGPFSDAAPAYSPLLEISNPTEVPSSSPATGLYSTQPSSLAAVGLPKSETPLPLEEFGTQKSTRIKKIPARLLDFDCNAISHSYSSPPYSSDLSCMSYYPLTDFINYDKFSSSHRHFSSICYLRQRTHQLL